MTEEFQLDSVKLEGSPLYLIGSRAPTITKYIIIETHKGLDQKWTIKYKAFDEVVRGYTIGNKSGEIGGKFQLIGTKAVLTLFKKHYKLKITDIKDAWTRKFVLDAIEDDPEYFI